jgi:hypothetical protein
MHAFQMPRIFLRGISMFIKSFHVHFPCYSHFVIPILAPPVDNSVGTVDNFAHSTIAYAAAYAMQAAFVHPSCACQKLQFFLHFKIVLRICNRVVEGFIF